MKWNNTFCFKVDYTLLVCANRFVLKNLGNYLNLIILKSNIICFKYCTWGYCNFTVITTFWKLNLQRRWQNLFSSYHCYVAYISPIILLYFCFLNYKIIITLKLSLLTLKLQNNLFTRTPIRSTLKILCNILYSEIQNIYR